MIEPNVSLVVYIVIITFVTSWEYLEESLILQIVLFQQIVSSEKRGLLDTDGEDKFGLTWI